MGELECDGAFAIGTHRKLETEEMSVAELELKSHLLRKKKTGRHLERTDLNWLCREIWRKRRALKREKHLGKIKESAEMGESSQENAKQAFQLDLECKTRKHRICSHKLLPKPLLDSGRPGGSNLIRERILGRFVEKLENGLCRRHADFTKETGKSLEEVEKRERLTGSDHGRCFESIASRKFGETDEIAVDDVLGYVFPRRLAALIDGNGTESGGCNVLDQVQADCWTVCDAENGGAATEQCPSAPCTC